MLVTVWYLNLVVERLRVMSMYLRRWPTWLAIAIAIAIPVVFGLSMLRFERVRGFAFTPWWSAACAAEMLIVITLILDYTVRVVTSDDNTTASTASEVASAARVSAISQSNQDRTNGLLNRDNPPSQQASQLAVAAATNAATAAANGRRAGLKSLVVGLDGRASTSKTQAALWTYSVLFVLSYMLVIGRKPIDRVHTPMLSGLHGAFSAFINQPLQPEYFALLGLPIAGAVAAKGITSGKVASGLLTKTTGTQSGVGTGLGELISNDQGQTDLLDFQYLAFNIFTLAYYFVAFATVTATKPSSGFPQIPTTLLALSGVSATGYLFKKQLDAALAPAISSVTPLRVVLGVDKQLLVAGSGFFASTSTKLPSTSNQVTVDGRPVATANWTPTSVTVVLPVTSDSKQLAALGWRERGSGDPAQVVVYDESGNASSPVGVEIEFSG